MAGRVMGNWYLGMMSGTSLDGVDAALIETDGRTVTAWGAAESRAYPPELRTQLRRLLDRAPMLGAGDEEVLEAERLLTLEHARLAREICAKAPAPVAAIGFHGQTILHRPDEGRSWQIGDAGLLAGQCALPVVADFRSADVAAGGQGAPLVPVYHAALCAAREKPLAVVNIGGVANVTWIGAEGELLAFDCGPGNALIDDWMAAHGFPPVDRDGRMAAAGQADRAWVARVLRRDYFARKPPKSLDRNDFSAMDLPRWTVADGAASLTLLTARAIAAAAGHFPANPVQWLICGGGRHNRTMMAMLSDAVKGTVTAVDEWGWRGDMLEAEAFAFLAARHLQGLPLSFPGTTGVPRPMTGGVLFSPGHGTR